MGLIGGFSAKHKSQLFLFVFVFSLQHRFASAKCRASQTWMKLFSLSCCSKCLMGKVLKCLSSRSINFKDLFVAKIPQHWYINKHQYIFGFIVPLVMIVFSFETTWYCMTFLYEKSFGSKLWASYVWYSASATPHCFLHHKAKLKAPNHTFQKMLIMFTSSPVETRQIPCFPPSAPHSFRP